VRITPNGSRSRSLLKIQVLYSNRVENKTRGPAKDNQYFRGTMRLAHRIVFSFSGIVDVSDRGRRDKANAPNSPILHPKWIISKRVFATESFGFA